MKIDISQVLCAPDGKPFIDPNKKTLTLRDVVGQSLGFSDHNSPSVTWEDALIRRKIADRLYGNEKIIEFSAEEITMIKPLIAKSFLPFVVADAILRLESTISTDTKKNWKVKK